ncbi:EAL domain protein [compost metagenome]|jgi:predicted signal transduction protein with EAL and GGDEF domain
MGLECVVEGVETPAELAALEGLGATLVQGYIYAPPLKEEDVDAFLAGQATGRRISAGKRRNRRLQ